ANLAVAYNSTFSYSLVQVGDEQLIVSALLLSAVAAKCGWEGYQIIRSLDGAHLSQLQYQHPFCKRTGKLYAGDSFVENSTGTGSPGKLSSQLPTLLAKQDTDHFPGHGSMVHRNQSQPVSRARARRDQPGAVGARLGQKPHRSGGPEPAGLVHLPPAHLGCA